MKKNNILILSAGRRVELVQDFQTEAARFSDGIGVFATDLNPHMSSACHVADRTFSVPRIDAAEYIDSIFELAQQHDIGLIVPTIDTELLKLAEARDRFEAEGIHIVISDAKLITLCRDKRLTSGLFAQYSIRSPEIYERDRLVFPCFTKPYDGSRAIGAKKINTPAKSAKARPGAMPCMKSWLKKWPYWKAHAAALPRNSSSAKPTAQPTAWKSTRVSAAVSP